MESSTRDSVAELLEMIGFAGISVEIDGADLICKGPRSALTSETVENLKQRKAEIITYLANRGAT